MCGGECCGVVELTELLLVYPKVTTRPALASSSFTLLTDSAPTILMCLISAVAAVDINDLLSIQTGTSNIEKTFSRHGPLA